MAHFRQALESTQKKFYLVRYGDDIIGFLRFDPEKSGHLSAASFNIRPDLRGAKIGETILKSALDLEAKNRIVHATAYPKLPITSRYIGEFGFVVTGILENFQETGESFFQMLRDDKVNPSYRFLNQSFSQIARSYETKSPDLAQSGIIIKKFDLTTEYDQFLTESRILLRTGQYVMTAFARSRQEPQTAYLVFEPKKTTI